MTQTTTPDLTEQTPVQIDTREAEHSRRPWPRFFVVYGGHIHSSRACTTCYPTTQFGWLPMLSGKTEADAVAHFEEKSSPEVLCSVCYPSAPVEWRTPRPSEDACPGTGKAPVEGTHRNRFPTGYGRCPECGSNETVTASYSIRKHKHAGEKAAAEAAARLADPKLISNPDGSLLKVDGQTHRTVRAAEIAYVDALMWARSAEAHGKPSLAEDRREHAVTILAALAAKAGTTPEAVAEKLAPRVTRKAREWGLA